MQGNDIIWATFYFWSTNSFLNERRAKDTFPDVVLHRKIFKLGLNQLQPVLGYISAVA